MHTQARVRDRISSQTQVETVVLPADTKGADRPTMVYRGDPNLRKRIPGATVPLEARPLKEKHHEFNAGSHN